MLPVCPALDPAEPIWSMRWMGPWIGTGLFVATAAEAGKQGTSNASGARSSAARTTRTDAILSLGFFITATIHSLER